ncbi:thiopurine s-methyltransferase family protein [Stagonosporopsis vannaccii]|nr:thiopurine s-methyltransferase family protein [Stagonosporopsis vannaccii]
MATQNQDRLRDHFASLDTSSASQGSGWNSLWEASTFLPWDRGLPNPALVDLLASPASPPVSTTQNPTPGAPAADAPAPVVDLPPSVAAGRRKKALVPGCGTGYDVRLLAAYGWDAVGLEVSPHAAEAARAFLSSASGEAVYKVQDGGAGEGSAVCVVGDFFEDGWLADAGVDKEGAFDIIYDNTVRLRPIGSSNLHTHAEYNAHTAQFLCALPPSLRPQWAARVSALLAKDGVLICLEFPTHKPASSGGPPWSLPPTVHAELLKRPGEEITYDEGGVVVQTQRGEGRGALRRVAHWTPARTHEVGVVKGVVRDCVSVWRHA